MTEKKITITLEDYSKAVDAVIKQMTLGADNETSKRVLTQIALKVAWDLWIWLKQAAKLEKVVDAIAKVADERMEKEEGERR